MPQRDTTFGEFVFQVRQSKGWSLRKAAKHVGIAHSRLDEIEKMIDNRSGKYLVPSYTNIVRLANAYGLRVDELLRKAGFDVGLELDAGEKRLLDIYRRLPVASQAKLIEVADAIDCEQHQAL